MISMKSSRRAADLPEIREGIDALREDLRQLKADAVGMARSAVHSSRGTARRAKDRFVDAFGDAADTSKWAVERVQDTMERRPILWTASILGLGLLLGAAILSSRRRI